MTNKEIKNICKEMQAKHCSVDWKFRITQTKTTVNIHWEYIDSGLETPWRIDIESLTVYNEHNFLMNEELESDLTLAETVKSIVYYMCSRY